LPEPGFFCPKANKPEVNKNNNNKERKTILIGHKYILSALQGWQNKA